jgi:hypothetical protein
VGRPEQLNQAFAELAETLVGDFDLAEALDRVVGHCVDACGAAGVGIVVQDGRCVLRDVAYSDDQVRRLERFQVQIDEGPCVECVRAGCRVVEPDLVEARTRWPRFAPAATEAGFLTVRALPLRFAWRTFGALSLFDLDRGNCAEEDLRAAQALADLAVLAVVQHVRTEAGAAAHISRALAGRSAIEQARSLLAHEGGITLPQASDCLRAHAARTGVGLTLLSRALVEGETTTEEILQAGGAGSD